MQYILCSIIFEDYKFFEKKIGNGNIEFDKLFLYII